MVSKHLSMEAVPKWVPEPQSLFGPPNILEESNTVAQDGTCHLHSIQHLAQTIMQISINFCLTPPSLVKMSLQINIIGFILIYLLAF